MKKVTLISLVIAVSFCFGFAFKTIIAAPDENVAPKVTGIGGIFFKCKDPKQMRAWYQQHLGLNTNPYGATFDWYEAPDSSRKAQTQWTPFPEKTKYFAPSQQDFMINYRVQNLEALVAALKKDGVSVVDTIVT